MDQLWTWGSRALGLACLGSVCRYPPVSDEVINLCGHGSFDWEGGLQGTFPATAELLSAALPQATQLPMYGMPWVPWPAGKSQTLLLRSATSDKGPGLRAVRRVIFFFWSFVLFFRPTSVENGGPQARGQIRAVAAGLHHSSRQCQILNPLREARDRTCNLMVPHWIHFHCATTGTPGW